MIGYLISSHVFIFIELYFRLQCLCCLSETSEYMTLDELSNKNTSIDNTQNFGILIEISSNENELS